jgi:NAD(P)-dependent dehydrogenase (short-subunit alcohol dehydrogenase family)
VPARARCHAASGIRNPFPDDHSHHAPAAYPEVHYLTSPAGAAGRKSGYPDVVNDGLRVSAMETYAYSTTTAGVHMLTRHLAGKLAAESITVNAVAPGPFDSTMMAFALDDPQTPPRFAGRVPLGRIGEPDDMAGAALCLASRAGRYLTGAVIPVDGGLSTIHS